MTAVGDVIGNIRIVRKIARGSMGEVFEGVDETLQRTVAIKAVCVEKQLDQRARARLFREAQVLSHLEHPNVCRLYELRRSDIHEYMVMEYIRGKNLMEAASQLEKPAQKLRVAASIAHALVAAHADEIIHRDLKPQNVMLADDGEVKVLDFGLAHSLAQAVKLPETDGGDPKQGPDATARPGTFRTEVGIITGTPMFMSPEQARGESLTTASDIFSFGLLLQWLFSGQPPYPEGLSSRDVVLHAIQGKTVPLENTPGDVRRLIERMTSLMPTMRPTAVEVRDQLQRMIEKPMRRVRQGLVAAVCLLLLLGSTISTLGFLMARRAKAKALEEAIVANTSLDMLEEFLVAADPGEMGRELKVVQLLDEFEERLMELDQLPLVQARLLTTCASTYLGLGMTERAEEYSGKALAIQKHHLGIRDPQTLTTMNLAARIAFQQGRLEACQDLLQETLVHRRDVLGETHRDVLQSERNMAVLLAELGRLEEAEKLHRDVVRKHRMLAVADPREMLMSLDGLAVVLARQGKLEEAEPLLQRVVNDGANIMGPDHPRVLGWTLNLAAAKLGMGEHAEAEQMCRALIPRLIEVLGPGHTRTLRARRELATAMARQGRHEEAERAFRDLYQTQVDELGQEHPDTLFTLQNLASCLAFQGDYDAASQALSSLLQRLTAVHGDTHPETLRCAGTYAYVMALQSRETEARELCRDALQRSREAWGDGHPSTWGLMMHQARIQVHQGRIPEADEVFAKLVRLKAEALGEANAETHSTRMARGRMLEENGALERAAQVYRECAESGYEPAQEALARVIGNRSNTL